MAQSRLKTLSRRHLLRWYLCLVASLFSFHSITLSQYFLKDEFPNLSFHSLVGLYHPDNDTNRLWVVEQGGVIQVFPDDSSIAATKVFLDIHDSVASGGELGLLGLAFHPHYSSNGFFYVDYTRDNPLRTVVSRFHVSLSNPDSADLSSEVILLEQLQPFVNHNGGQLAFGQDGYLYIAFGDGGSAGDPLGNGQDKSTLLGKILRINVDSTSGMQHYTIPPDNPFYGDTIARQEIYAYGLRNPWRFSFDRQTFWCADVGQNSWEEIDTIARGRNYGWNTMEGKHCFSPSVGCDTSGLTLPIWEYDHDSGRCSVTGGFVYSGSAIPSLTGKYIYSDYCTGEIWALSTTASLPSNSFLLNAGRSISSFGEDSRHEIYVCDYDGGKLYRLSAALPGPFTLVAPANDAMHQPNLITLMWTSSERALKYRLEVAFDSLFLSLAVNDSTIHDTIQQVGPIPDSTLFFWRVRAANNLGSTMSPTFRRFTTAQSSVQYHLMSSWNLISLPLDVADGRRTALFPSSSSNAFDYVPASGYRVRDTLVHGVGYWLKFDESETIGLGGTPRYIDTIDVLSGWNLIGSISQSIPAAQVSSIPGGVITSQFFDYQGSYISSDTLESGKGYWVKVTADSKLILSSISAARAGAGRIRIEPTIELPPLFPGADASKKVNLSSKHYSLAQNYPNPFNPATVIGYQIPEAGSGRVLHVSLKVYDVLGREVAMLVDGLQGAGDKSAEWDASKVTSGFYFCKLIIAGKDGNLLYSDVKKMLLMK